MGKKEYSEHHTVPRSRGNSLTVQLPKEFHTAWHTLFGNLYGREIIIFLNEVNYLMEKKRTLTARDLHELRERVKSTLKKED